MPLALAGADVPTTREIAAWLDRLAPGQSLCWYRGYLPTDRIGRDEAVEAGHGAPARWRADRGRAVSRLANFMWRQANPPAPEADERRRRRPAPPAGLGFLWQRRLADMHYEYWFTRAGTGR
ncbi:MAG: hypothetical protein IPK81_15755 [Rhodospirillales bacterium]|nr:MAG: hypothetical protein IPK81_15755 [Rhodospirillales bacterium]